MTDRGPTPKAPNRNATGRDGADGLPEAEQMDWRLRSLWTQRGSAWRREMKHLPREPLVVPLPAEQQTPDPEESEGSAAHAAVHRCPALAEQVPPQTGSIWSGSKIHLKRMVWVQTICSFAADRKRQASAFKCSSSMQGFSVLSRINMYFGDVNETFPSKSGLLSWSLCDAKPPQALNNK